MRLIALTKTGTFTSHEYGDVVHSGLYAWGGLSERGTLALSVLHRHSGDRAISCSHYRDIIIWKQLFIMKAFRPHNV